MQTITIHTLTLDTRDGGETEVYADWKSLLERLHQIMTEALQEAEQNRKSWAKTILPRNRAQFRQCGKALKKWRKRLQNKSQTWRQWQMFVRDDSICAIKDPDDYYSIGDHDIPLPPEVVKALQCADASLTDYHRHLWNSNKRTHGGIQRGAVVKTVQQIRKALGTNTPGQKL